ncbi:MAG: SIR2 family protein [Arachnia sp.]
MKRPESIILTRAHYLDFALKQRGLASLATALLMTKHLLFVGFGLADDHFHEIVHEVRSIRPTPPGSDTDQARGGTALVLGDGLIHKAVWGKDFTIVPFTQHGDETNPAVAGRSLEIFLDVMVCLSGSDEPFTLDPRFQGIINRHDLDAAKEMRTLHARLTKMGRDQTGPARRLLKLLVELGHSPQA